MMVRTEANVNKSRNLNIDNVRGGVERRDWVTDTDPMTNEQRLDIAAGILAKGILRRVDAARRPKSAARESDHDDS